MQAIKLKARISEHATLEWLELIPELPPGEVEIIVLYEQPQERKQKPLVPATWPVLNGGQYRGGTLRREEIYDDDGR